MSIVLFGVDNSEFRQQLIASKRRDHERQSGSYHQFIEDLPITATFDKFLKNNQKEMYKSLMEDYPRSPNLLLTYTAMEMCKKDFYKDVERATLEDFENGNIEITTVFTALIDEEKEKDENDSKENKDEDNGEDDGEENDPTVTEYLDAVKNNDMETMKKYSYEPNDASVARIISFDRRLTDHHISILYSVIRKVQYYYKNKGFVALFRGSDTELPDDAPEVFKNLEETDYYVMVCADPDDIDRYEHHIKQGLTGLGYNIEY